VARRASLQCEAVRKQTFLFLSASFDQGAYDGPIQPIQESSLCSGGLFIRMAVNRLQRSVRPASVYSVRNRAAGGLAKAPYRLGGILAPCPDRAQRGLHPRLEFRPRLARPLVRRPCLMARGDNLSDRRERKGTSRQSHRAGATHAARIGAT
jgi:hypothetical protein